MRRSGSNATIEGQQHYFHQNLVNHTTKWRKNTVWSPFWVLLEKSIYYLKNTFLLLKEWQKWKLFYICQQRMALLTQTLLCSNQSSSVKDPNLSPEHQCEEAWLHVKKGIQVHLFLPGNGMWLLNANVLSVGQCYAWLLWTVWHLTDRKGRGSRAKEGVGGLQRKAANAGHSTNKPRGSLALLLTRVTRSLSPRH